MAPSATSTLATPLARELMLRAWSPEWGAPTVGNYDPTRECPHRPDQTYTRKPCSCGRELWPPKGRGRGESLSSPRRVAAKLKSLQALELHAKGYTYAQIARKLGYRDTSGAWRAVQRVRDDDAAWSNYERRTGHKPYSRHQPTHGELQRALAVMEREMRERETHTTLDDRRLAAAKMRLVCDVLAEVKRKSRPGR